MSSAHRLSARAAALWLAACAGMGSGPLLQRPGGAAQGPARVAYAAQTRAKVYSEPSFTANVVGVLTWHEKLERFQSDGGFAYVKAEGNLAGWVPETQLVEKLPARKPAAQAPTPSPSATPKSEAPPEEAVAPPEETPPPEEPTETEAEPPEPERSVFDPY
jgi:hypothetical protein